jgi:hypothetical protein
MLVKNRPIQQDVHVARRHVFELSVEDNEGNVIIQPFGRSTRQDS